MNYRRSKTKGATFFFTLVTYQRQKIFQHVDNIHLLQDVIRKVKTYKPFQIDAFVILPDHLHYILTLPEGDDNFSVRWQIIKEKFTKRCAPQYKTKPNLVRTQKNEQCVWQRRFWEHEIRNEEDFIKHVDYIHYNPVKHQHVAMVRDWPHSSFHDYVQQDIYPSGWAGKNDDGFDVSMGGE